MATKVNEGLLVPPLVTPAHYFPMKKGPNIALPSFAHLSCPVFPVLLWSLASPSSFPSSPAARCLRWPWLLSAVCPRALVLKWPSSPWVPVGSPVLVAAPVLGFYEVDARLFNFCSFSKFHDRAALNKALPRPPRQLTTSLKVGWRRPVSNGGAPAKPQICFYPPLYLRQWEPQCRTVESVMLLFGNETLGCWPFHSKTKSPPFFCLCNVVILP